jgi:murein peptide amidase A
MEDLNSRSVPRERRGVIPHIRRRFGLSRLGAPLEIYGPEKNPGSCLVIAGQHGTEPESTVLLSSVLRTIPEGKLWCPVVPSLNPDGIARGTRCNASGVDLNRNFPTSDWSSRPVSYSWNNENPQDTELSAGPEPVSEPETEALLELVKDLQPEYIISIHAPMECIDDPGSTGLGKWLSGETGLPLVTDIGYPVPGSFGTWAGENDVKLITFELPSDSIQNIRRKYTPVLLKILTGEYREYIYC